MLRLIGSLSFIWLLMAICAVAKTTPVLDATGQPLESGVEYFILPAEGDVASGLTSFSRNESCPLYVVQLPSQPTPIIPGIPVIFTPYVTEETTIMESRDFSLAFTSLSSCEESTAWRVGDEDPETGRRYIIIGGDAGYFNISRNELDQYVLGWCPNESCPTCDRPRCGFAGIEVKDGIRFLVLDGPAFAFEFRRFRP